MLEPDLEQYIKERVYVPDAKYTDCCIKEFDCIYIDCQIKKVKENSKRPFHSQEPDLFHPKG